MSFFNRKNAMQYSKDAYIKANLLKVLAENIREIQFEHNDTKKEFMEITDCTLSFCSTLEAIFLHGIKDSLLKMTMKVMGNDEDGGQKPEPSFWSIVLIFSHKQVIEQILSFNLLQTEIGHCRSWIRQSINDCILSSYFSNIKRNIKTLKSYYKNEAFIRDPESIDLCANLIEGLEAYGIEFRLPCNTSLLNQWETISLQMSGIWTPPLRACPISSGVDIAGSLPVQLRESNHVNIPSMNRQSVFMESISNSLKFDVHMKQDIIDEEAMETTEPEAKKNDEVKTTVDQLPSKSENSREQDTYMNENFGLGNELINHMRWGRTNSLEEELSAHTKLNRLESSASSISTMTNDRTSFRALINNAQETKREEVKENIQEIWKKYEENFDGAAEEQKEGLQRKFSIEELGYEIIQYSSLQSLINSQETLDMIDQLCKLANEKGLDEQNFKCMACEKGLALGYQDAKMCYFDGYRYCSNCMSSDLFAIPARIISCWDFKRYPVSKKAEKFFFEFQYQPLINMKNINPEIYIHVDIMFELQNYRVQLNFIRAYLFTCCNEIYDQFQKVRSNKDYLYDHIHQYSINDLLLIPFPTNILHQMGETENLVQILCAFIDFGRKHILQCQLCSQKGFICEICSSKSIIYPFDLDKTYRCEACFTIFHRECFSNLIPCPKCERKRRREDLPLLELHNN